MPFLVIDFPVFTPIAVSIGPIAVGWYALAYIGGIVLGWIYARSLIKKERLWGRPADASVPWAMVFPNGGPLPRHPSQLYEAGREGILLFTILAVMIRMG